MKTIFLLLASLLPIISIAQLNITSQIQNETLTNLGAINLTVVGGTAPYSYLWNDSITTNNRTNLKSGSYTITVSDDTDNTKISTFEVFADVSWKNVKGVNLSGKTFNKSSFSWDGGAFSNNILRQGEDGIIRHTITSLQHKYMIGVSDKDLDVHHSTVDCQIFINTNQLKFRKNGSHKANGGNLQIGDVIEMEKVGNSIIVRKNNVQLYSFNDIIDKDYHIDIAIYQATNLLIDITTSFTYKIVPIPIIIHLSQATSFSGSIDLSNTKGGTFPYSYLWSDGSSSNHLTIYQAGNYTVTITDFEGYSTEKTYFVGYDVLYKDIKNIDIFSNNIEKSLNINDGWNAGFASKNIIQGGKDGSFTFEITKRSNRFMIGLSNRNRSEHWNTIDYAIFISNQGMYICSKGKNLANLGAVYEGDKIEVRKIGGVIYFHKNGENLYKLECDEKLSYVIDMSKYSSSNSLELNVKANFPPNIPKPADNYILLQESQKLTTNVQGGVLKIKIRDKKADELKYTIYDVNRNVISSDLISSHTQSTTKGFEIPINSLIINNYYTLEIAGGKSEKYYLKFIYN